MNRWPLQKFIYLIITPIALGLGAIAICITGCSQPRDSDVSANPRYNFSTFANTLWKTKVKVALADVEGYNRRHSMTILSPESFDTQDPKYRPPLNSHVISILPVGTSLRVGRLMQDNGNWGGFKVTGFLEDGREVELESLLLATNSFIYDPLTSQSTNWGVQPEMLEAAEAGGKH